MDLFIGYSPVEERDTQLDSYKTYRIEIQEGLRITGVAKSRAAVISYKGKGPESCCV